jgi:hypothetical protein
MRMGRTVKKSKARAKKLTRERWERTRASAREEPSPDALIIVGVREGD